LDFAKYVFDRSIIECDVEGYDLAYAGVDPKEELEFVLKVHKSDQHWQAQVVDMETGKPLPAATAQVKAMQIEGTDNYAFFPEDKVFAFQADSQGHIRLSRFSSKDGISLEVSAPNYAEEQKWFSAERPDDTTFRLTRAGTITGRVTRTDGGELPADLRVSLVRTSGSGRRDYVPVEKDGSFSWDHCTPGSYTLSAISPTTEGRKLICPSACEADIKSGETVEVVIEMEKGVPVCHKRRRQLGIVSAGRRAYNHVSMQRYEPTARI